MSYKLLAAVLAASVAGSAAAQTPPPASAFARLPAVTQAAISPNGQRVAILGGGAGDRTLSFTTIDQPGASVLRLGDVETIGVTWAGDNHAIARYAVWEKVGPRNDYRFERNVAVAPDGKVASFLLKSDVASSFLVQQPVIGIIHGPEPRVLVRGLTVAAGAERDMNTRMRRKGDDGNPLIPALFSVDPASGRGTQVERGDFDTEGWDVDLKGQARVAFEVDELTDKFRVMARPKGVTNRWDLIQNGEEPEGGGYLGYSDPEDAIYLARVESGSTQVVRRNLADGAVQLVGMPVKGADVWLKFDPHRGVPLAITADGERPSYQWLDAEFGAAYASLSRAFKDKTVSVNSWSQDRTRMIFSVEGPDTPPVWYLFDRPRKELSPIGEAYPELKDAALGRTSSFRYKAADGLEIPAWLTLPPGAPATGGKLPLVVLPHGGPSAHDDASFDYMVHFLASRGYAVLRPQYRGSTGFGPTFEKAGDGEWGGKMQSDLVDGVQALAAERTIDPSRVCIVGASFGGYAALHGAVFRPAAYRCAASFAGVADLGLLLSANASDYGRTSKSFRALRREIRGAASDKLATVSPLKNASKAGVPILLLHGDQDTIVDVGHSRMMADALTKAGKPVQLITFKGENHYLTKASSRTEMLSALEAFLAKHIPVSQAQADR